MSSKGDPSDSEEAESQASSEEDEWWKDDAFRALLPVAATLSTTQEAGSSTKPRLATEPLPERADLPLSKRFVSPYYALLSSAETAAAASAASLSIQPPAAAAAPPAERWDARLRALWRRGLPVAVLALVGVTAPLWLCNARLLLPLLALPSPSLWLPALVLMVYFNLVWALAFASWLRCMFTSPGHPLSTPSSPSSSASSLSSRCRKCQAYKVERAHHCRHCEECTLRMDHHCWWVMTCVGLHNHKHYFLLTTYSCISAGTVVATFWFFQLAHGLPLFSDPLLVALFVESAAIWASTGYLWAFHWRFLCMNMTTIEFADYERKVSKGLLSTPASVVRGISPYDLGREHANVAEVMGHASWLWPFPI